MPAEIPNSGRCDVRLCGGHEENVYVYCQTHDLGWGSLTVETPEEAWAWEQAHRRDVANGGVNVAGTLVEPDL